MTEPRGHTPTLVASFMHFDLSFMLWVLIGALGNYIAEDLRLSPSEKGLLVAVPILSGSLLRVPLGLLADRVGARRVGLAMLCWLYVPLVVGSQVTGGLAPMIAVGVMLGVAGASFAVALPLASRWYPATRQGLVMGIAAAGNSGTVVANLAAPLLAAIVAWRGVLGLATIPLTLVLASFLILAKDSPARTRPSLAAYLTSLTARDLWCFGLLYSVTFGGYVGLSGFLPIFLRDQYHVDAATAGYLTAALAFGGSVIRPLGGHVADVMGGGARALGMLLAVIAGVYLLGSRSPDLPVMLALLSVGMLSMGAGNGAVFQLVPQRFRAEIGIATGLIGALGGLGGFVLPTVLGAMKQSTGSFAGGFVALALLATGAFVALVALVLLDGDGWRIAWRAGLPREDRPTIRSHLSDTEPTQSY